MWPAGILMPAFTDNFAVVNHDASHKRIRIGCTQSVFCQLEATHHVVAFGHETNVAIFHPRNRRRQSQIRVTFLLLSKIILMRNVNIREIQQSDDPAIAKVIRDVLIEHDVPRTGTAFADPELDHMFETYNRPGSVYFVVELDGAIVGGAGVAPLANQNENICELQKMYFLPEARGLGIGNTMMEKCLIEAKKLGYEKCYLET